MKLSEETANWLIKVMRKGLGEKWTQQEEKDYRLWIINNSLLDLSDRAHILLDKIEASRNRWYVRSSIKELDRLKQLIDKLTKEKNEYI